MDAAAADLTLPANVRRLAASAQEIILCHPEEVPSSAYAIREAAGPQAQCVALCPASLPAASALRLIEYGYQVFEAKVPPGTYVLFDRRAGFHLPGWEPIPDSFEEACRVMWTRTAGLLRLKGHIAAIEGEALSHIRILRLAENPYLRLTISSASYVPTVGQHVIVLGRIDFLMGTGTPLVECLAVYGDNH